MHLDKRDLLFSQQDKHMVTNNLFYFLAYNCTLFYSHFIGEIALNFCVISENMFHFEDLVPFRRDH